MLGSQAKKSCERESNLLYLRKQNNNSMKKKYSVWVGGVEVNDYYLSKNDADDLAKEYKDDGYDDVVVRKEVA